MPLREAGPLPHADAGRPAGKRRLKVALPAVVREFSAGTMFWRKPPPEAKSINCANPVVTCAAKLNSGPGSPAATSATGEPVCGAPTVVTDAIRSGRTPSTYREVGPP